MGTLEIAKDLLGSIPLTAIAKEKADLLKAQIETMEGRLKLADDRVRFAEEKSARIEAENASLRAEVNELREIVAASALTDEYEMRGKFAYKKGESTPRCPDCKTTLNEVGAKYSCRKCGWEYRDDSIQIGYLPDWRG